MDRQPEVIPCPSLALTVDTHALQGICFLWLMEGRQDSSFFSFMLCTEETHKLLTWAPFGETITKEQFLGVVVFFPPEDFSGCLALVELAEQGFEIQI